MVSSYWSSLGVSRDTTIIRPEQRVKVETVQLSSLSEVLSCIPSFIYPSAPYFFHRGLIDSVVFFGKATMDILIKYSTIQLIFILFAQFYTIVFYMWVMGQPTSYPRIQSWSDASKSAGFLSFSYGQ